MSEAKTYQCVVTIAGSDSSGGAGIQADIKTLSATGCYAASVITALTAQNTQGVQAVASVPPEFIKKQIESVFNDLTIRAVKIGMLHTEAVIAVVADALNYYRPDYVVLDPVMVAKSGHALLEDNLADYLQAKLFPLVYLITPNLPEAEKLLNKKIISRQDMQRAAIQLGEQFKTNVLLKGGHLTGNEVNDVLYVYAEQQYFWHCSQRIITQNTHGTGCTLSSAIASYLAQNYNLQEAVARAKHYLTGAIQAASQQKIGLGCGPVDHFYLL